jgi:hypothetical protein
MRKPGDWVEYTSQLTYRMPGRLEGIELVGFALLPRDPAALGRLADQMLNDPSGGALDFRPLPFVLVTFCRYAKLYSLAEPDCQRGAITYSEVALWTFMVAARDLRRGLPRGRICVYLPYLFVDNQYAMAGGRESLGLPKNMATITMPGSAHDPARYGLSAIAFKKFGPDQVAGPLELVKVRDPNEAPAGATPTVWTGFDALIQDVVGLFVPRGEGRALSRLAVEVGKMVGGPAVTEAAVLDVAGASFPVIALRQFRSGANAEIGSAQSILTFTATIRPPLGGGLLLRSFDVSFTDCASHPIASDLGLADSQRALGAFRASFGMDVGLTSDLWTPGP